MNKKVIIVLAVAVLALIGWGTRVYYVNAGVATTYEIDTYQIGDEVAVDNATLTVKNATYGVVKEENGYKSVPLTIEMEVRNTSDDNISVRKIIEAKLAYGRDYYQTRDGEFDINVLGNLPPETTTNISLTYHVAPDHQGEEAKLYIGQSLYGDQVMEKYDEGKRYGVAVEL